MGPRNDAVVFKPRTRETHELATRNAAFQRYAIKLSRAWASEAVPLAAPHGHQVVVGMLPKK